MATQVATPRARALGFGLHRARTQRRVGLRELARMAAVSEQDLSHWEHGRRIPKIEQVALLLGCLRVEEKERERLFELTRNAREPNWLERVVPGAPRGMATFAEYERTATVQFDWEPSLIPGLLQTADYARAILARDRPNEDQVERQVTARLMRQELLTARVPLELRALIGEAALKQDILGAEVMVSQLRRLLKLSEYRNVSLRVLPTRSGHHPGVYGPFMILDYAELPPIVYLEQYLCSAYLYDEDQVTGYRSAAKKMAALALSEQDSCALIREVIAGLEGIA